MIVAAAVCPHPPALVPEIGPGADEELGDVRRASDAAVAALLESRPERIVVVGTGPSPVVVDESAGGTLAGYGVDVRAGGAEAVLPLSLTIGAWLLDRAGWTGPRTYATTRPDVDGRVALLVMADGTATRSVQAPGFLDERAEGFDAAIADALASGDVRALALLDLDLADALGASGAAALRVLGELLADDVQKGADVTASLRLDVAPLGVGWFVADWVVT